MKNQIISVSAFIPWEGKALIVQRVENDKNYPGYWEQAGGRVDYSEHPDNALVREVREETGLTVKPLRPYHVHDYVLQDGEHAVEIAYYCELVGQPNVALSQEHQAYKWVTEEELQGIAAITDNMRAVILHGFQQA